MLFRYNNYIPVPDDETKVDTSNHMRCTAYLLDEGVWYLAYGVPNKSDWVIGGPTLEMVRLPYDIAKGNPDNLSSSVGVETKTINGKVVVGYNCAGLNDNNTFNGLFLNNGESYWLASPSSQSENSMNVVSAHNNGFVGPSPYHNSGLGFRPVVCLSNHVYLERTSDGSAFCIK